MRAALILVTGLFVLSAASAHATPISDTSLNEVYRSCVASAPASTTPDFRERYCSCFRDETRRVFTQDTLAALEQRMRANATTMLDREQIEGMQSACFTRAREAQAPAATPAPRQQPASAPPPPPPQAAPAPAPQGTPLTSAELDAERRECLASIEQSAANVPAPTRERFCGCAAEWMQRTLTRETLAGLNQRQRSNTLTMQDREQMQEVTQTCLAQAQRPASAVPGSPARTPAPQLVSRPPAPPAVQPAPAAPAPVPSKKTPA